MTPAGTVAPAAPGGVTTGRIQLDQMTCSMSDCELLVAKMASPL
jgi:hypothetical protein